MPVNFPFVPKPNIYHHHKQSEDDSRSLRLKTIEIIAIVKRLLLMLLTLQLSYQYSNIECDIPIHV